MYLYTIYVSTCYMYICIIYYKLISSYPKFIGKESGLLETRKV